MSRKNIYKIQDLSNGVLISFKTDSGLRHYRYGAVAGRKIREDNRDPREFKATEVVAKESK